MQTWQVAASIAAVIVPLLGIINAYLLNQVRLELSTLKLQMLESRALDAKETRAWAEGEFLRKSEARLQQEASALRLSTLEARMTALETRRRANDALHASS